MFVLTETAKAVQNSDSAVLGTILGIILGIIAAVFIVLLVRAIADWRR